MQYIEYTTILHMIVYIYLTKYKINICINSGGLIYHSEITLTRESTCIALLIISCELLNTDKHIDDSWYNITIQSIPCFLTNATTYMRSYQKEKSAVAW